MNVRIQMRLVIQLGFLDGTGQAGMAVTGSGISGSEMPGQLCCASGRTVQLCRPSSGQAGAQGLLLMPLTLDLSSGLRS